MNTSDFTTSILVDQKPEVVFNAVNNVRGWWSENVNGDTDKLNSTYFYHYKDVHLAKIKVIELVPDKRVVWQVLENHFSFIADKSEWVNSKIIFEITEKQGKTELRFTHQGLVPECECYDICNDAWTGFIKNSLYNLITTGKGHPTSKENDKFNVELIEKWLTN
ncbi:ATPase [Solitalea longa]|uniref:ATPase n=1 Tax=Solitalea longa TaxID=2079460 RepID=A0A2S5A9H7_9SPHI|nr:SRPBCC domain-containing protein [Solitalea longa]POY39205.1 ATPase [Solitalea longa]